MLRSIAELEALIICEDDEAGGHIACHMPRLSELTRSVEERYLRHL
jgi:hypothetical protein